LLDIGRWEEALQHTQVTYERVSLEQVCTHFRFIVREAQSAVPRFLVLGPPGSGKTTLVQYLAWQAVHGTWRISERQLVPARVRLRTWEAWARAHPEAGLPEYLHAHYRNCSPEPKVEHWQQWLQQGEVLILLDGLDEITTDPSGTASFSAALYTALMTFTDCPTVLTCRTASFERYHTLGAHLPLFTLAGLDNAQRNATIRAFPAEHATCYDPDALIAQLDQTFQMHPLAANPLLLSLICFVMDDPQSDILPYTRGDLYGKVVEKLLTRCRSVKAHYPGTELDTDKKRRILEKTALRLFVNDGHSLTFTEQALERELGRALSEAGYGEAPALWATALRADLVQNSGILRRSSEGGYCFLHLMVQEFLAAAALARVVNAQGWQAHIAVAGKLWTIRDVVDVKGWDPRWQEVIMLLVELVDDPLPALELLSDPARDDLFRHRLCLSARCLPELLPEEHQNLPYIFRHLTDCITRDVFNLWWEHQSRGFCLPHVAQCLPLLAQSGSPAVFCVILERLRDADCHVRRAAAEVLGCMGEAALRQPEVLPALLTALRDADWDVRGTATVALGQMGAAVALPLLAALRDVDWNVRSIAAQMLGRMGEAALRQPEVLPALLTALRDADWDIRWTAAGVLGWLGEVAARQPEVLPALLTALHDADHNVRQAVMWALRRMGKAATQHPEALPALVAILYDADCTVRQAAVEVLGRIGRAAVQQPEVLPALVGALRDVDRNVRQAAAEALGRMGEVAACQPEVLPALVGALRDVDRNVRQAAAEALGRMGEVAACQPEVLPALLAALCDTDRHVRQAVMQAFRRMGETATRQSEVLPLLAGVLHEGDRHIRQAAVEALGRMGETAVRQSEVLPLLAGVLHEGDRHIRQAAVEALGRIGAAAVRQPGVLPVLAGALRDIDRHVRQAAAEALGQMGETAARQPEVLPGLVGALRDVDRHVRQAAVEALGRMGVAAARQPEVLSALLAALRDTDWNVCRVAAVEALGRMGVAAARQPEVLSALLVALRDTDWNVCRVAARALEQIAAQDVRIFVRPCGTLVVRHVADLSQL
jgi:HEAT repeat protein